MRVILSYPDGPAWGHKMRCEILADELRTRGHEIVEDGADIVLWDHPYLPSWLSLGKPKWVEQPSVPFVSMGTNPIDRPNCWAWHPLGEPGPRTLTGKEYLILDPKLAGLRGKKKSGMLISMGAADTEKYTEVILYALRDPGMPITAIQGPNFERKIESRSSRQCVIQPVGRPHFLELLASAEYVVCGWGATAFEAVFLGSQVMPIVRRKEHDLEARQLFLWGSWIFQAWSEMRWRRIFSANEIGLDLNGASRTVAWLEMLHEVYGEKR